MVAATATTWDLDPAGEAKLLGFKFEEVAQFDIERLDLAKRQVQIRDGGPEGTTGKAYAPKDSIEYFMTAIKFNRVPPIVVTADNWIIDGHTRVAAQTKNAQKFLPAIVLEQNWDGASEEQKRKMRILGFTLNGRQHRSLERAEIHRALLDMVRENYRPEEIQRRLGIKVAAVTAAKQEVEARRRMERVGLSPNGAIKGASLRVFGRKDVVALNDAPYKALVALAADASMNSQEIAALAREAKDLGSDTLGVNHLKVVRSEMEDRIRNAKLTGASSPPVSRQLRQHLGFITKFADDAGALVETNAPVWGQHIKAIRDAIAVLSSVLDLQPTP